MTRDRVELPWSEMLRRMDAVIKPKPRVPWRQRLRAQVRRLLAKIWRVRKPRARVVAFPRRRSA